MGSGESGPMDLGGAKRSRSPSAASPVAFWLLCRHGQSNSPPAGGETPREQRNPFRNLPPHPPPSGAPSPPGGRLFRRIFVSIRITNVSDEDLTGEVEDCLEFTLNFVQTQGANLTKMSGYFLVKCTFLSVFCVVQ